MIATAPNEHKDPAGPQSSLSGFSQIFTPFTEANNSLHGTNASLKDEMGVQMNSSSATSTVIHDSKTLQMKTKFLKLILRSPRKRITMY